MGYVSFREGNLPRSIIYQLLTYITWNRLMAAILGPGANWGRKLDPMHMVIPKRLNHRENGGTLKNGTLAVPSCLNPPRSPLKEIYQISTHYIRCIWG